MFAGNGRVVKWPPGITGILERQRQNSYGYTCVFGVKLSSGGTSGFVRHVLEIQDGSQLTGSSNISETMTHIIKIPTATTMFSGSSFLVMTFPISWDVDMCQKSNMAAKLPEVVITSLFLQMHMSFQNQYRGL